MSKLDPWKRSKDRVAICGFSQTTRDKTPWNDPEYEIWIMNEEYNYDWCLRYDRVFQMHPRWNFTTLNNPNDPNHFSWLQNKPNTCVRCGGSKEYGVRDGDGNTKTLECTECDENGLSILDPRRENAIVYMQKEHKDIPNSVAYPLKKISEALNPYDEKDYYSSTCTYALAMAMYLEIPHIEIYGIEMAAGTEYSFQRPNMEYWIGLARGKGFDVKVIAEAGLMRADLYGYTNMKIGYRQDVEARMKYLENQAIIAKTNADRYYGRLKMIDEIMEMADGSMISKLEAKKTEVDTKYQEHIGKINYVSGAQREAQNLSDLYDVHFLNEVTGEHDEQKN